MSGHKTFNKKVKSVRLFGSSKIKPFVNTTKQSNDIPYIDPVLYNKVKDFVEIVIGLIIVAGLLYLNIKTKSHIY